MKHGTSAFLLKDIRPEQLADAVRVVARGEALLAPKISRWLVEEFVRRRSAAARQDGQARMLRAPPNRSGLELDPLSIANLAASHARLAALGRESSGGPSAGCAALVGSPSGRGGLILRGEHSGDQTRSRGRR